MQNLTITQINESLLKLSPDKLAVVYDFISYLLERNPQQILTGKVSEGFQTMLASEAVLQRDWNSPEEDAAWADL